MRDAATSCWDLGTEFEATIWAAVKMNSREKAMGQYAGSVVCQ